MAQKVLTDLNGPAVVENAVTNFCSWWGLSANRSLAHAHGTVLAVFFRLARLIVSIENESYVASLSGFERLLPTLSRAEKRRS
jgi:hypothetical protein